MRLNDAPAAGYIHHQNVTMEIKKNIKSTGRREKEENKQLWAKLK